MKNLMISYEHFGGIRLRDALTPFLSKIPMVERPIKHVPLKTKLAFTIAILILLYAMTDNK